MIGGLGPSFTLGTISAGQIDWTFDLPPTTPPLLLTCQRCLGRCDGVFCYCSTRTRDVDATAAVRFGGRSHLTTSSFCTVVFYILDSTPLSHFSRPPPSSRGAACENNGVDNVRRC